MRSAPRGIAGGAVELAEVAREGGGGVQRADGGGDGERVDAAAFFPQVPGGEGRPLSVAVLEHPLGGADDQREVEGLDELDVAEGLEVLAQRPEDEGGLVLLDGEDALALEHPGVPARGEFTGGGVLVEEVAVALDAARRRSGRSCGRVRSARRG
jgi:hypothetical protein